MDIKLLRIDSRLVHGQVANNWAGTDRKSTRLNSSHP